MSCITNEPKHKNGILQAIREQLEHRAMWLYLLCDEAQQKGLAWEDFAETAIRRCGCFQGMNLVKKGKTDSFKGLKAPCLPCRHGWFSKWILWKAPMKRCPSISITVRW